MKLTIKVVQLLRKDGVGYRGKQQSIYCDIPTHKHGKLYCANNKRMTTYYCIVYNVKE